MTLIYPEIDGLRFPPLGQLLVALGLILVFVGLAAQWTAASVGFALISLGLVVLVLAPPKRRREYMGH